MKIFSPSASRVRRLAGVDAAGDIETREVRQLDLHFESCEAKPYFGPRHQRLAFERRSSAVLDEVIENVPQRVGETDERALAMHCAHDDRPALVDLADQVIARYAYVGEEDIVEQVIAPALDLLYFDAGGV